MESYPFDDVTPAPAMTPADPGSATGPAGGSTPSRVRKVATGVAIGVAVLATGGVAIAATHSGSTTAAGGAGGGPGGGFEGSGFAGPPGSTSTGTTGAPTGTGATGGTGTTGTTGTAPSGTGGRRGFGGPGGAGDGLETALHGTFVVPATSGTGTTTDDLRSGAVTAVSATSITVTSTDKTVGTFVVTSASVVNRGQSKIADVKIGDTVTVIAADATKTALSIDDDGLRTGAPGDAPTT